MTQMNVEQWLLAAILMLQGLTLLGLCYLVWEMKHLNSASPQLDEVMSEECRPSRTPSRMRRTPSAQLLNTHPLEAWDKLPKYKAPYSEWYEE